MGYATRRATLGKDADVVDEEKRKQREERKQRVEGGERTAAREINWPHISFIL